MKLLLLPLILLMFVQVKAQDCKNTFTSYAKGASFEMTHYDAKNTAKGKNTSTVTDVKNTAGGKTISLHSVPSDGSNKNQEGTDITIACEGSTIKLDFAGAISSANALAGKGNFEMKFDKTDIEFPANPTVGQTVADDKIVMSVVDKSSGTSMGNNTISFKNRKVVGKQSVTTPAGTFDCFKMTSDMSMEMSMMGRTMPARVMKSESYFCSSVGMVKAITYDENQNVTSSSVLTKVSK